MPIDSPWFTCPRALGLSALLAIVAAPTRAHAALGGDVASVGADTVRLGGARTVTPSGGWEIHEIRVPNGTVIREYLSAGGTVFAVAWSGPRMPDFRQLFGASFSDYVALSRRPHAGHHHLAASGARLAVQAAGHNHSFVGRAWVPTAVPTGFDLRVVR